MPKRTRHTTPLPRQIVGISLPPEIAAAVKAEATRRDITMRQLFIEMWKTYKPK